MRTRSRTSASGRITVGWRARRRMIPGAALALGLGLAVAAGAGGPAGASSPTATAPASASASASATSPTVAPLRTAAQERGTGALALGCDRTPAPGHARCFLWRQPADPNRIPNAPDKKSKCKVKESAGYAPCNIQAAYGLSQDVVSDGAGSTVAVVDAYDDPKAASDLNKFRSHFKLPKCTTANGCFAKVNQTGQQTNYPSPNADFAGETSLDLDMVSTACPKCHILLVEANSNGFGDLDTAITEAVTLGARVVSDSWGSGESSGEASLDTTYDAPGVAITFSSGDGAYQGGVQYPAASNYVTSVGGTELTPDAGTARGWDEATWVNTAASPPTQGSGSGCSAYEGKPAWQSDAGCAMRTTADVSMVAANVLGYDTYQASGWYYEFGTSVSSPLVAGLYGLAHNPASTAVPVSAAYGAPAGDFHDITSGSTGTCSPAYLCTAGPGYDGPTGLGSPDGIGAFEVPATPTPTVSAVVLGGTSAAPTLTVQGSGFGSLPPPGSPEWDCGGSYTGDVFGGVGLNFGDTTAGWTAGQGGDCLGLTVTAWSATSVTLALGNFYPDVNAIHVGDTYTFELQGASFGGSVS